MYIFSALAVVSQRIDLIEKVMKYDDIENGKICFSLFINGYWRDIVVDNYLPCKALAVNIRYS
jgi:hypothetical protein